MTVLHVPYSLDVWAAGLPVASANIELIMGMTVSEEETTSKD